MPVAKLFLLLGMVAGLAMVWSNRAFVVDAYSDTDGPGVDVKLGGLDLTIEPSPIPPSPYEIVAAPDTREVPLKLAYTDVPAVEQPVSIRGGTAQLRGIVTGPDGPVPSATVRLERHSLDGVAVVDLTTDDSGRWSIPRILGGRYRVRSWLTGGLTMAESEVFFLDAGTTETLDFGLHAIDPSASMSYADRGDIYVGLSGTVAISVTTRTVDSNGIVVVSGVPGAIVGLTPSAGVTLAPSIAVADTDGVARFVVTCQVPGSPVAAAVLDGRAKTFNLPDCIPVEPVPTTVPVADPNAPPTPTTSPASAATTTQSQSGPAGG